jgi:thiol-disulfide isomerase/thioredoxin
MAIRKAHRKRKKDFPAVPVVAGLFLIGMVFLFRMQPASGGGYDRAPDLSLENLNGRIESLAEYRRDVVLVNNWAIWCPPCKAEMPVLESYYEKHAAQGFTIIAVEAGSAREAVLPFVNSLGLTFQVWLDPNGAALRAFENSSLPNSYVIDRSGAIRRAWAGRIDMAMLEEYVTPLLGE